MTACFPLQGALCRVWDGSKPVILQPKDEPYVFNSPVFRLATMELDGYPAFINQSEKVIEHSIHHIITVPSGKPRAASVLLSAEGHFQVYSTTSAALYLLLQATSVLSGTTARLASWAASCPRQEP